MHYWCLPKQALLHIHIFLLSLNMKDTQISYDFKLRFLNHGQGTMRVCKKFQRKRQKENVLLWLSLVNMST